MTKDAAIRWSGILTKGEVVELPSNADCDGGYGVKFGKTILLSGKEVHAYINGYCDGRVSIRSEDLEEVTKKLEASRG